MLMVRNPECIAVIVTQTGVFTQPEISVLQMKEFCTQKMVEMKIPRFLAKFYAMGIPRLERWRN